MTERSMRIALRHPDLAAGLAVAVLGAALLDVPMTLWGGREGALIAAGLGLLGLGFLVGYLKPHRPWRWAVAAVSLWPLVTAVQTIMLVRSQTTEGILSGSPGGYGLALFFYWLIQNPIAIIPALPALVGAYTGAFIAERCRTASVYEMSPPKVDLVVGFVLGGLASVPYLWAAKKSAGTPPLWLTPALVFLFAWAMGARIPGRYWQAVLAIGSALPLLTTVRIVVDISRDPTSHSLFPFEILFALVFAYPAALVGAYASKWTHSRPLPKHLDRQRPRG